MFKFETCVATNCAGQALEGPRQLPLASDRWQRPSSRRRSDFHHHEPDEVALLGLNSTRSRAYWQGSGDGDNVHTKSESHDDIVVS